jgi:ring-1,2-phenylacetyl-CoA epoxidase subunit PaaE
MPKKSIINDERVDPATSTPAFTQGISALLKCFTSIIPRMEWMSEIVIGQLESTLHSDLLTDPLKNLPPVVRETLLQLPKIAWPTVFLFLANLFVMLSVVILREFSWVSYWAVTFVLTCSMFVMFTVAHDAAHGSISKDFKWLNGIVGRISFGCLGPLGCFVAWKWIHHMHHKYTNHPSKDPDRFCSGGSVRLAPLRCAMLVFYQLYWYLGYAHTRPALEILEFIGHVTINSLLIWKSVEFGLWPQMIFYWIIPSFLAFALLAFFFDFVPHHDHEATPIESRYHTTSMLKTYPVLQPLLTLLLQYQDYHLIHHLYPTIPFYRYVDKWQEKQDFLLEKNVKIQNLTIPFE